MTTRNQTQFRAIIILADRAGNKVPIPGPVRDFHSLADIDCIFPREIEDVEEYLRKGWSVSDESNVLPVCGPDYRVSMSDVDALLKECSRHDGHDGREAALRSAN